jgi:hypothetical protein
MTIRPDYPTVEVCSKCLANTSFSWDDDEGAFLSVCCTRPAWATDALADTHDA